MAYPTRPFWEGLDKVLAALHCHQVAPCGSGFYFEFTVDRQDGHRLANGFPELQKLAAAINKKMAFEYNPSTGKLSTMSLESTLAGVKYEAYSAIAAGLDSSSHLAAVVLPMKGDADALAIFPIGLPPNAPTTMGRLHYYRQPQQVTPNPLSITRVSRTVAVVKLALPMREIDTEKQMKRLAERSFVSVFTRVDGKVKEAAHRNPLSAPGGAIKLWLSDLVGQDHLKGLPHECVRPLYNEQAAQTVAATKSVGVSSHEVNTSRRPAVKGRAQTGEDDSEVRIVSPVRTKKRKPRVGGFRGAFRSRRGLPPAKTAYVSADYDSPELGWGARVDHVFDGGGDSSTLGGSCSPGPGRHAERRNIPPRPGSLPPAWCWWL
ncbi:hypothetical protein B0T24DRAFT_711993 [Lasiosphaeria ovina]|uniref:Uncharacterized protein n=1 Tax=Lasiosphaeria ovina TaxID=92902 RepID=A0AAE0JVI7_9PEZI|nr:hypothetical protein B0T24DRAFT_711993 [Lasiosphaeria ovina]